MTFTLFVIFGVVAVACGLAMVLSRNPVYGAIYLIGALGAIAGEFLLLNAPFLAALQVLVYAGAIMVLYLFVIMLLNLGRDPGFRWWTNWRTYVGLALTGLLGYVAFTRSTVTISRAVPLEGHFSVQQIARHMFSDPTIIFLIEALGVLLTIAVVGGIYLGRRFSPAEEAEARRAALYYQAMMEPGPGPPAPAQADDAKSEQPDEPAQRQHAQEGPG